MNTLLHRLLMGLTALITLCVACLPGYGTAATDLTFNPVVTITIPIGGTSPIRTVTDIDKDGHLDVLLSDTNSFAILYGHGDGTFTTVSYPGPASGANLGTATVNDFNKDGINDIAFCAFNNTAIVYLGAGSRTFNTPIGYTVGSSPFGITSGDLNGDGYPDIATANNGSSNISILFNDGTGAFGSPINYPVGSYPKSVIAANLRNNGILDLIDGNHYQSLAPLFINDGLGVFTYVGGIVGGGGNVVAADLNGDGFNDIAGTNYWGGHLGTEPIHY